VTESAATPEFTFTVFTGTHNRAATLHRPYDSLRAQTFRDFEWLIIDNESTDETPELVRRWQAEADFPIRYEWQTNIGHHGSVNRAVVEARGRFFTILDSDDAAVPDALERFLAAWESIPASERERFVGVTALCRDERGHPLGGRFPFDPTDSNSTEMRYRYKRLGERWGFQRTDVMREFGYPTIPGYTGMFSGQLLWGAIGRRYTTRYINEYLGVVTQDQPDTLTKGSPDPRRNAPGEALEAHALLEHDMRYFRYDPWAFYLKAAKYIRSALLSGHGLRHQVEALGNTPARALWAAALPVGIGVYIAERLRLGRFLPGAAGRGVLR
jgi:glycosyltransferase involved in cell wall biosynthesis